jgi:hypothetical protein
MKRIAPARVGVMLFALSIAAPAGSQEPPAPSAAAPLRVSSAVVPETVTVGDRFRSVLRIEGAPGGVVFSQLPVGDSLQPFDSLQVLNAGQPTAIYSLVAWVTGTGLQARVPIRLQQAGGDTATYIVPLRLPVVLSVLPDDTAALVPRPHRAVFAIPAAGRAPWWPWLLLLLLLVAGAAGAWWLARGRSARDSLAGTETARERARRELARLTAPGLPGSGEHAHFYPAATGVLRRYLAAVDESWGLELTSSELVSAVRAADGYQREASELQRLLAHADGVKFGQVVPTKAELHWFVSALARAIEELPRNPEGEMPGVAA